MESRTLKFVTGLALAVVAAMSAVVSIAQDFPVRPIRVVVPFGAGGGTDNLARIIAPRVGAELGQSLVIENKPGGGSIIGPDAVVKAKPSVYTLLMVDSSIAANPSLYKSLPY